MSVENLSSIYADGGERTKMSAERPVREEGRLKEARREGAAGCGGGAGVGDSTRPVSKRPRMVALLVSNSTCFAASSALRSVHICGNYN